MKKFLKYALILALLLFLLKMYDSNPSKEEYIDWISEQATSKTESIFLQSLLGIVTEHLIENYTTHSDYLLFSIYETDLTDFGMKKVKVIGILGKFIPIDS